LQAVDSAKHTSLEHSGNTMPR